MTAIYILEGADGTGKTTFAERVAAQLMWDETGPKDVRFIHNTADDRLLPGSLYAHYRAQLVDAVQFRADGVATIIDRSFLSEHVYGSIYRKKPRISARQVRRLERLAYDADIVMLGFTATGTVRRMRLKERGEIYDLRQPLVGAFYSQHFRDSEKFWTKVDTSSSITSPITL